jgi:hypothetical protein
MSHPYKSLDDRAFWKRAVSSGWDAASVPDQGPYIRRGERVASAGSCFAANIVPFIEAAGFAYVRAERGLSCFGELNDDYFSYSKFSAAYGNIYTVRQAVQLLRRAQGSFRPEEDRWIGADDLIVDPFRPGLRFKASSDAEFDALTAQHLGCVLSAIRQADVFVFTLGLTEAWLSAPDGAVFPACPGTIAGVFDTAQHRFHNFTTAEVNRDLDDLVAVLREIRPGLRIVLTVSPVPLVATATSRHVLAASIHSKSVLRAAAGEAVMRHSDVLYFPAYEIVTGPQAPFNYFETDRREPSAQAIAEVMRAFLANCEGAVMRDTADLEPAARDFTPLSRFKADDVRSLSSLVAEVQCEEAAAGI